MTRSCLAVIFALPQAALAAAPLDIGVAAAVRGAVRATAPGGPAGRVVETGRAVYHNDRVTTGPAAKLQVLLADETSFTMGPDSEMVLDEFVYDPATSAGKVSARVTKGAFRFITGKVARRDPGRMRVATPVATIGIRGTMVAGQVGANEATVVLLGPGLDNNADERGGAITVSNEQGSVDVDRDGWGVTVRAGQAPSDPFRLTPGQLDGILAGVASAPQGGSEDGSGGETTASAASGEETAAGKETASQAFAALEAEESETSQFASQQFSAPKASTWESVRGIASGTGHYSGSAPYYNCTGGTCAASATGAMTFLLNIDFGARTVGGGGSKIELGSPVSATGTIGILSYANLSGEATANLAPVISGAGTWTGTSLKLLDSGGVTAGAASLDVRFFDGSTSQTYQGAVSGSLAQ